MSITNKQDMYELLCKGMLGNTLESWPSIQEMSSKSSYRGLVGVRSLIPGGLFMPNVKYGCLRKVVSQNFKGPVNISQMIPLTDTVIQGHIIDDYLQYSFAPVLFRDAMAGKTIVSERPLTTRSILRYFMDDYSYQNIERLHELYPNHAIEFIVTKRMYGIYKWNTIIWEVRLY